MWFLIMWALNLSRSSRKYRANRNRLKNKDLYFEFKETRFQANVTSHVSPMD